MIVVALLFVGSLIAAVAGLAAEDRPHLKRIDVSPALQDRATWEALRSAKS